MRYLFGLVLLLFNISNAYALAWGTACTITTARKAFPIVNKSISIDPDTPNGTIIYNQSGAMSTDSRFTCTMPVKGYVSYDVIYGGDGSGGTIDVVVPGYGSKKAYATGVQGIAALVVVGNGANPGKTLPVTWTSSQYINNTVINDSTARGIYNPTYSGAPVISILYIKYGPIPSGAQVVQVNNIKIPPVMLRINITGSADEVKMPNTNTNLVWTTQVYHASTSTLNILNSTCTAPMVPVNLGEHNLSKSPKENGRAVSPWVDASINLTNCPVFYGIGSKDIQNDTVANTMKVTITPGNATTSTIGLMPINSGADTATNVGIQLAWGTEATQTLLNFATGKASNTYPLTSTQGTTFKIPLVARYRQINAGTIMGGNANGQMTYIVEYY